MSIAVCYPAVDSQARLHAGELVEAVASAERERAAVPEEAPSGEWEVHRVRPQLDAADQKAGSQDSQASQAAIWACRVMVLVCTEVSHSIQPMQMRHALPSYEWVHRQPLALWQSRTQSSIICSLKEACCSWCPLTTACSLHITQHPPGLASRCSQQDS